MMRWTAVLATVAVVFAVGCGSGDGEGGTASTPKPTPKAFKPGGVRKMGELIKTPAGSRVGITNWVRGAPERPDPPGPGQQYQSVGVGFCAGPTVDVTGREIVPLFSLELPGGDRVSPDSATGKKELRSKGKIDPGDCVLLPIVFQVGGGRKPAFVVFESDQRTKWKVP